MMKPVVLDQQPSSAHSIFRGTFQKMHDARTAVNGSAEVGRYNALKETPRQGRTILVGGDDPEARDFLEMALRFQGYEVELAEDGQEVLDRLGANHEVSAVLLDFSMPGMGGLEALREIRSGNKELPVIMCSDESTPKNIVEAMRCGATDFLRKPLDHQNLRAALQKALDDLAPAEKGPRKDRDNAFGQCSPRMRELYAMGVQVGASEAPVLIQGETGTGKEVLARHLHSLSPRSQKRFLKINCAALPPELVESELFGYERGAFTGALRRKPGMFEMADGGTLLLDEIGDMDFKLQAKLLQVLQDYEFQRLGGQETVRVNVRVMAATHNDLEGSIAAGEFRQDLYYRLSVVTLYVPPLRERKEDIMPLTEILLRKHAGDDAGIPVITPGLQKAMLSYDWPGNIRELENVIRRLLVLCDADAISRDLNARSVRKALAASPMLDLPAPADTASAHAPILERVSQAMSQAEEEAIQAALTATHWNRKKAAARLEINYKVLLYKMRRFGMDGSDPKPQQERSLTAEPGHCA